MGGVFFWVSPAGVSGGLDGGFPAFGGPGLQQVYATAHTADLALGPDAADAWKNRRDLSVRLTAIIDKIMSMMGH